MRVLTFEQITDDRFDKNTKQLLENRLAQLKQKLNIKGIKFVTIEPFRVYFDTNTQWRSVCYISKSTNKITWQDIFKIINSVHATKYNFINMEKL